MYELIIDLVRVIHFLGFAVGIGAAVFLEGLVLSRARVAIEEEELALIEHGHRLILLALGVLWLTGFALIGLKTGFDPALVTGKMQMKMWVVAALTANAFVIAWVATPLLRDALYSSLSDMHDVSLAMVGGAAGLSAAGWLSALVLGGIGRLATMPISTLGPVFSAVMVAGAIGGAVFAIMIGRRGPADPMQEDWTTMIVRTLSRRAHRGDGAFARLPSKPPT